MFKNMKKNRLLLFLLFLSTKISLYAQQGLKGYYHDGTNFERFVATRIDPNINFLWRNKPPIAGVTPDKCSIRWLGYLTAPETGDYVFSAKVDDGIRVWVNNQLLINSWQMNDMGNFQGTIKLQKGGSYPIKIEYFNGLLEGEINVMWTIPKANKGFQTIESQYFTQTYQAPPPPKYLPKPIPQPNIKPTPKPTPKPPLSSRPNLPKKEVLRADTLEKYVPKNVLFERTQSVILPASFSDLDKLCVFLLRYPYLKIKIEGHTDIIGDNNMNQKLSEERAEVVKKYLIQKRVNANRIAAIGYGSTRPLINDGAKTGHPENRRVVFIVY